MPFRKAVEHEMRALKRNLYLFPDRADNGHSIRLIFGDKIVNSPMNTPIASWEKIGLCIFEGESFIDSHTSSAAADILAL